MKATKLTPRLLRKIIEEEVGKFGDMEDVTKKAKETDEVEPDELADALEKHIDYAKALKIEQVRLTKRLAQVKEARARVAKKIAGSI